MDTIEQLVIKATFAGASATPEGVGLEETDFKCNYFLGNSPAQWRTDVPNYSSVVLKDVYPGIDVRYANDDQGNIGYEFIATSGADLAQIEVQYEGVDTIAIDLGGRPILGTKWGHGFEEIRPGANCVGLISPRRTSPPLRAHSLDAAFAATLQAAPAAMELVYGTYLGGSGDDYGYAISVDASGAAYVTGLTFSADFPTVSPYQVTRLGGGDAFVTKVSSTGNGLVYSSYLGGSNVEEGYGIAVDSSGAVYVTGHTYSTDFPTANAYQTNFRGGLLDVFVAKLSSAGNSLVYGTYLGGTSDEYGYGLAVNTSGEAYITGTTRSDDFPTASAYLGAFQGGTSDAFVTRLSIAGDSLAYGTYLGGTGEDLGVDVAVDAAGTVVVTGRTWSTDFPTVSAYQGANRGASDLFVARISVTGSDLVYATYLGGTSDDYSGDIALDTAGAAYVTGTTYSADFPTAGALQDTLRGGGDAFVAKLSSAGSSLVYATYLGGTDQRDSGSGIAVDSSGAAYVTGTTYSTDFPTAGAYQATKAGGFDLFVAKLSSAGSSLVYGTYLGGTSLDSDGAIAVDASGAAYVTGLTRSTNFPTANAYQGTNQGASDAFAVKLEWIAPCPIASTGDVNTNGAITAADVIHLVNFIYKAGAPPAPCEAAGDTNCSGTITPADIIHLVNFVFKAGPLPCDVCSLIPTAWTCP